LAGAVIVHPEMQSRVPADTIDLANVATFPELRGGGVDLRHQRERPLLELVGEVLDQVAAATARTGIAHVRLHVPERTLTTWLVLDVSPSMAFGTAHRLKADVAEGVALVFGRLGVRRAGSVGTIVDLHVLLS